MLLTIIIPYYNAPDKILQCLDALDNCYFPEKFEVIVVDDGSDVSIEQAITEYQPDNYKLRVFQNQHYGQSAATNFGIKQAQGEFVLLFAQDMLADKNLLCSHLEIFEQKQNSSLALLGYMPFSRKFQNNDFLDFLLTGPQFAFQGLKQGDYLEPGKYFYAPNIFMRRDFLLENGLFDQEMQYGFQDLELGYRLGKKGLNLVFNKNAVAYHLHKIDLESFCAKLKIMGKMAVVLHQKHPQLKDARYIAFLLDLNNNQDVIKYAKELLNFVEQKKQVDKLCLNALVLELAKSKEPVLCNIYQVLTKISVFADKGYDLNDDFFKIEKKMKFILYKLICSAYFAQGYFGKGML
ncbi:MAG: hypothetical protein DRP78_07255 [Candidatus Omnitrophota bacterium]|nr:MAG: hypothetical protein DRP78_07255 [Candidatus Omnitrophota bacterium]